MLAYSFSRIDVFSVLILMAIATFAAYKLTCWVIATYRGECNLKRWTQGQITSLRYGQEAKCFTKELGSQSIREFFRRFHTDTDIDFILIIADKKMRVNNLSVENDHHFVVHHRLHKWDLVHVLGDSNGAHCALMDHNDEPIDFNEPSLHRMFCEVLTCVNDYKDAGDYWWARLDNDCAPALHKTKGAFQSGTVMKVRKVMEFGHKNGITWNKPLMTYDPADDIQPKRSRKKTEEAQEPVRGPQSVGAHGA